MPRAIAGRADARDTPNFVFIYIDDLGWRDLGFMGSRFYETPRIDRLAGQGMVFTNAYANAPNCAPSRACLMSGQYPPRHGVYTVGTSERGQPRDRKLVPVKNTRTLDPQIITIPEALRPAGYVSAAIGKWHLGDSPREQGFDVTIAGNTAGSPRRYFDPSGEYLTDRLTDDAVEFIDEHAEQPFFLYLSHYAVHTPIQGKPELIEKYRRKKPQDGHGHAEYAAMIDSVDQSVGRVLDKLDELKLTENTVVVFFSDNGGYGPVTTMAPLRGAKGMLYEGGIRVPLVVRWPGKVEPDSRCEVPVIGIDFYPTMLAMAGVKPPQGHPLDGESLVPLLEQSGDLERDAIFWHFPAYLEAYRGGMSSGPFRATPAGAVRKGRFKLIEHFEDGRIELYDLENDVGEKNDLAESSPAKAQSLLKELRAWRKRLAAPVPTDKNPAYQPGG